MARQDGGMPLNITSEWGREREMGEDWDGGEREGVVGRGTANCRWSSLVSVGERRRNGRGRWQGGGEGGEEGRRRRSEMAGGGSVAGHHQSVGEGEDKKGRWRGN